MAQVITFAEYAAKYARPRLLPLAQHTLPLSLLLYFTKLSYKKLCNIYASGTRSSHRAISRRSLLAKLFLQLDKFFFAAKAIKMQPQHLKEQQEK